MPKSKLSALLSLLLVFSSGVLVGGVAYRLYMVNTVQSGKGQPGPPQRPSPDEIKRHIITDYRDRVKMDDQQIEKLSGILDETKSQFDEIRHRWNTDVTTLRAKQAERIRAILRPDQVPAFEQLQAEREAQRKKHQQQK